MPFRDPRVRLTLALVGTVLMASACADSPAGLEGDGDTAAAPRALAKGGNKGGGGGGGGTGAFPATVVLAETANLFGDGKGAYADGSCGVQAEVGATIAYFKPSGRALKGKERNCGGRSATVVLTSRHVGR